MIGVNTITLIEGSSIRNVFIIEASVVHFPAVLCSLAGVILAELTGVHFQFFLYVSAGDLQIGTSGTGTLLHNLAVAAFLKFHPLQQQFGWSVGRETLRSVGRLFCSGGKLSVL